MRRLRTTALALLLGATMIAPALAITTMPAGRMTFEAVLQPERGGGGYDGTLNLWAGKGGLLNGYFRLEGGGESRPVQGAIEGGHIWLDLGQSPSLHVEGTYKDGTIVGYTPDTFHAVGGSLQAYRFTAKIEPAAL